MRCFPRSWRAATACVASTRMRGKISIDSGNATSSASSADITSGTGAPISHAASWMTTVSARNSPSRASPIVPMTLVPLVGALVTGHGPGDIGDFFAEGLDSVMNVVVMFIFAIIFFGILQDVGLFTPVIKALIRAPAATSSP